MNKAPTRVTTARDYSRNIGHSLDMRLSSPETSFN